MTSSVDSISGTPLHPAQPRGGWFARRAIIGIAILTALIGGGAMLLHASIDQDAEGPAVEARNDALGAVSRWQRRVGTDVAVRPDVQLVVVQRDIDQEQMARLRAGPTQRLLLAELPLAEIAATDPSWQPGWVVPQQPGDFPRTPSDRAPAWLMRELPLQRGVFPVRFWQSDWRATLIGGPNARVDQAMAKGFDGFYLTGASSFAGWRGERPTADADMIDLIVRIATYVRQQRPELVVIMENGEELLGVPRLRRVLDAVAKSGLLYAGDGSGEVQSDEAVNGSLERLRPFILETRPVLAIEYVPHASAIATTERRLRELGLVPSVVVRAP